MAAISLIFFPLLMSYFGGHGDRAVMTRPTSKSVQKLIEIKNIFNFLIAFAPRQGKSNTSGVFRT